MYILHPLSRSDLTNGAACKARARIYYTELARPTIESPQAKHPFDYTYLPQFDDLLQVSWASHREKFTTLKNFERTTKNYRRYRMFKNITDVEN